MTKTTFWNMRLAVYNFSGRRAWTWAGSLALQSAAVWPALYAAPLGGMALAWGLLWWGQQPRRLRRGAPA